MGVCERSRLVGVDAKAVWSSGMIPASGAGGPGFDPRNSPVFLVPKHSLGPKLMRIGHLRVVEGACGVVVSRLFCEQKASGSSRDKSICYFVKLPGPSLEKMSFSADTSVLFQIAFFV